MGGWSVGGCFYTLLPLGIQASFIYTTFSHSEKHHKFRIVFNSEKLIENKNEALIIQNTLNNLFGGDSHCKNLNRIYYGGLEVVYENYNGLINMNAENFSIILKTPYFQLEIK